MKKGKEKSKNASALGETLIRMEEPVRPVLYSPFWTLFTGRERVLKSFEDDHWLFRQIIWTCERRYHKKTQICEMPCHQNWGLLLLYGFCLLANFMCGFTIPIRIHESAINQFTPLARETIYNRFKPVYLKLSFLYSI